MLIDISPLRVSLDYRLLFFGQLISTFGTVINLVVIPVQVYQLTGSTLLVGLVSVPEFAMILLLAFVGEAYADFIDKRKLLRLTEIGQTPSNPHEPTIFLNNLALAAAVFSCSKKLQSEHDCAVVSGRS